MPLPTLMNATKTLRDAAFRRAVQAQIDLWDAVREIETLYGGEFRALETQVEYLAVCVDCGEAMTTEGIEAVFEEIEEDDFVLS